MKCVMRKGVPVLCHRATFFRFSSPCVLLVSHYALLSSVVVKCPLLFRVRCARLPAVFGWSQLHPLLCTHPFMYIHTHSPLTVRSPCPQPPPTNIVHPQIHTPRHPYPCVHPDQGTHDGPTNQSHKPRIRPWPRRRQPRRGRRIITTNTITPPRHKPRVRPPARQGAQANPLPLPRTTCLIRRRRPL